MFRIIEDIERLIGVSIEGKITREDYDKFRPILERKIANYGKVNAVFVVHDIEKITPQAILDDKMDIKHANDFYKVAIVGDDDKWEKLTRMSKPFTSAEVRFFPMTEKDAAWQWIRE